MDFLLKEDGSEILQETGGIDFIVLNRGWIKLNNYLFVKAGNGVSVTEKIR